jgi:hypothetical protein
VLNPSASALLQNYESTTNDKKNKWLFNSKVMIHCRFVALCVHSCNVIPFSHKCGLLTIDIRQKCSRLDVSIFYKTEPAPAAKAQKCTHWFRRKAIVNIGWKEVAFTKDLLHINEGTCLDVYSNVNKLCVWKSNQISLIQNGVIIKSHLG